MAQVKAAPVAAAISGFDWQFYLNHYVDLRAAGITTQAQAQQHYTNNGVREGRLVNAAIAKARFNWQNYIVQYPDLVQAGIVTQDTAWQHYVNHGRAESRQAAFA